MSDRLRDRLPLIGVLVVAAAVRLFRLGHQSLWCDEWFSYNLCRQSPDAIWAKAVEDAVHPPLYYFLLHPIASRTPSEFWLRLPSVVFGVLSVWLAYCLALALTNRKTALVATWLMALSSFQVYHSQETRMYEMLTCFGLAALWALWKALESGRLRDWALFVGASALSLYTNYLAASIAVTAVGAVATHWRCHRKALGPLAASIGLVAVLWIPWGLAMLEGGEGVNARRRLGSVDWAVMASAGAFLDFSVGYSKGFDRFYHERPPVDMITMGILVVGLFCAAGLLGVGAFCPPSRGLKHWYLLHCLVGPFAIGFLIATQTHFKQPRYFVLGNPALAMLMAVGLMALFRRRSIWRWPLALGLGVATLSSLANYQLNWRYGRDDWRSVVAFMEDHYKPGDALLFNASWMTQPFNHYVDLSGRGRWPTNGLPNEIGQPAAEVKRQASTIIREHERVWLILCYDLAPDPERRVVKYLDRRALFKEEWRFSGVTIRLYECRAKV